jgi:hypothetical protein
MLCTKLGGGVGFYHFAITHEPHSKLLTLFVSNLSKLHLETLKDVWTLVNKGKGVGK